MVDEAAGHALLPAGKPAGSISAIQLTLVTDGDHDVLADLSSLHRHGIQFRALQVMGHMGNGYSTVAS